MTAVRSRRLRRARLAAMVAVMAVVGAVWVLVWPHLKTPGSGGSSAPEALVLSGAQAELSGSVVDAVSRTGLTGAKVNIDHAGAPLTVRTDSRGLFQTVVDASRPIALTVDAPGHQGTVAFGRLCPGERRRLAIALPPAGATQAPPAPIVLENRCP